MNNIKLADCTIRDGGHLNDWNFSTDCVKESYNTAVKSNIDFFEIGYRNYPNSDFGKFYTTEDEFLYSFIEPNERCKITVMADMDKSDINLFKECDKANTPISAVFVATYLKDLNESFEFCEKLFDKGYLVFLNLMAVFEYSDSDFDILKNWQNKNILESIYFADSFGAFYPNDVELISNRLKSAGFNNISFHAHNNLQLAFANCLKAIELGLYSIDASIYGMGRDAGNLPMELLLSHLNKFDKSYNPKLYFELIEKYYFDIHNSLNWGYNINSMIGGIKNIHPKYIGELAKTKDVKYIYDYLDLLKQNNIVTFDKENLYVNR